ncbi:MAG: class II aldolase/adducin family protein [Spirochaetia bacterium]|jgi:L-fuculose-phosphate aldolase
MKLVRQHKREVDEFLQVCRALGERMYVTSHGGNLSTRLHEDLYLITPTCMSKSALTARDLVFIDSAGTVIEGVRQPTGETPLYLRFFRDRPDVRSVIHCHPPFTNAFAILKRGDWLMRPVFPETVIEVGPVPVVPYGEPLTTELADGFAPFLPKYNAFLMENHGLVLISPEGIARTMQLIEILEETAITLLQALAVGEIKELPKEALRGLENTRRKRKLPMIGAPGENDSIEQLYADVSPLRRTGAG